MNRRTFLKGLVALVAAVALPANAALALESGFPSVKTKASNSTKTITTSSFTTTGPCLLVLAATVEAASAVITATAITDSAGGTIGTWTKRTSATWSGGAFNGLTQVEVWTALASGTVTSKTVTHTSTVGSNMSGVIALFAIDGYDTASSTSFLGTTSAQGSTSDPDSHVIAGAVTTTRDGSMIIGSLINGADTTSLTAQSGTTMDNNFSDATQGTREGSCHKTTPAAIGTYTVGSSITKTYYAWALLEILPSLSVSRGTLLGVYP